MLTILYKNGLKWLAFTAFGLGALAMLTHDLGHHPANTDILEQALALLQSLHKGELVQYLKGSPLLPLPVWVLAFLYGTTIGSLFLAGTLPSVQSIEHYLFVEGPRLIYFESRLLALLAAAYTLVLLARCSRTLFPRVPAWYAPALLCSSVSFLILATAIQPPIYTAFFTTLTLRLALRKRRIPALIAAAAALATLLPSGVFTFEFPIRILYPFKESGLWMMLHIAGDNIVLLLLAAIGSIVVWKRKIAPILPILLFIGVFVVLFGTFIEYPRSFYLPLIPFFALLGASGVVKLPRIVRGILFLMIVLINLKFAWLGFRQNTYERARDFLIHQTEGVIATDFLPSFLGIPKTRASIEKPKSARERYWLSLDKDLPHAREIGGKDQWEDANVFISRLERDGRDPAEIRDLPDWIQCAKYGSTPESLDGLLWSDDGFREQILLPRLFTLNRLGPTIGIYCRNSKFPLPLPAGRSLGEGWKGEG